MDVAKKTFMIIGAGRSGIAASRFLSENGARKIYLCDTRNYGALVKDGFGIEQADGLKNVETVFGRQPDADAIKACDLMVLSPGVPPDAFPCAAAMEYGVKIVSEIDLPMGFSRGASQPSRAQTGKRRRRRCSESCSEMRGSKRTSAETSAIPSSITPNRQASTASSPLRSAAFSFRCAKR
jgi:UDP-N-acetylmuramoylalanine--D-glutamate ligase